MEENFSPSSSENAVELRPAETDQSDKLDCAGLVRRIQSGEDSGAEELYRVFSRGVRFYLFRQLGPQDLDDKVHDTFLIVLQAIRRGELREPERLMGFVRTITHRQVAAHIHEAVKDRNEMAALDSGMTVSDMRHDPEAAVIASQREELILKVLNGVSRRDREILTRFYLQEQSQEDICAEMNLTDTQFRLLKSRAKARFGELGRKRFATKNARIGLRTAGA
ncbi:MAG: sigma-70 family RNA polymerase sigma factor [Bryobacterales bacterium]|nr:sigma-70 family RNA polymerase sigma factor [Bryobacterales bacterium]